MEEVDGQAGIDRAEQCLSEAAFTEELVRLRVAACLIRK
jgi:hypothetical protein